MKQVHRDTEAKRKQAKPLLADLSSPGASNRNTKGGVQPQIQRTWGNWHLLCKRKQARKVEKVPSTVSKKKAEKNKPVSN